MICFEDEVKLEAIEKKKKINQFLWDFTYFAVTFHYIFIKFFKKPHNTDKSHIKAQSVSLLYTHNVKVGFYISDCAICAVFGSVMRKCVLLYLCNSGTYFLQLTITIRHFRVRKSGLQGDFL